MILYSFFFQAEDGIRDTSVTGVQTCALPICGPPTIQEKYEDIQAPTSLLAPVQGRGNQNSRAPISQHTTTAEDRSEERRVGKECRYRRWGWQGRKKRGRRTT